MSGPIPKHSSQRVRRNVGDPVSKVTPIVTPSKTGPAADQGWHPIAIELFESLAQSAQVVYLQPTDWAVARVLCHLLSDVLNSGKPSAQMVASLSTMMSNLLLTEGDRRRVRIEIETETNKADVLDIAQVLMDRMNQDIAS